MNKIFKNNTSIITGSAGRFGKIISNKLAELGSDLILLDNNILGKRNADFLKKKYGIKVTFLKINLTNEKELKFFANFLKKYKKIDLLINNAAFII